MNKRKTKHATPRYVHCTFLRPWVVSTVCAKKTRLARSGATKAPVPCTACARLSRISLYRGGPQIERKGSAAVSKVERPAPTTNMLPQNPPNDRFSPLGQKRRLPTASTASPVLQHERELPGSGRRSLRTGHESGTETPFAKDPSRNGQGAQEVRSKVCSLQSRCSTSCYIQLGLEMVVQDIKKTIGEPPEEEKDRDWVFCQ